MRLTYPEQQIFTKILHYSKMYLAFQIFWYNKSKKWGLQAVGDAEGRISLEKSCESATTFQIAVSEFEYNNSKIYLGSNTDLLISDCGQLKKLELRSDGYYRSSSEKSGRFLKIFWNSPKLKWNQPINLQKACCGLQFLNLVFQTCNENCKVHIQEFQFDNGQCLTSSNTINRSSIYNSDVEVEKVCPKGKIILCPAFDNCDSEITIAPLICLANHPNSICGLETTNSSNQIVEFNVQNIGEGGGIWTTSWENPSNSQLLLEFVPANLVGVSGFCNLPLRNFVIRLPGRTNVMEVGKKYPVEIKVGSGFRYLRNAQAINPKNCFLAKDAITKKKTKCLKASKITGSGPNYSLQYELTTERSNNIVQFAPKVTGDFNQFTFPADSFDNLCFPKRTCCGNLSLFIGFTEKSRRAVVSAGSFGLSERSNRSVVGLTDLVFIQGPNGLIQSSTLPMSRKKSGTTAVPGDRQLTALEVPALNTKKPRGQTNNTNNSIQTRGMTALDWFVIFFFVLIVIIVFSYWAISSRRVITETTTSDVELIQYSSDDF